MLLNNTNDNQKKVLKRFDQKQNNHRKNFCIVKRLAIGEIQNRSKPDFLRNRTDCVLCINALYH